MELISTQKTILNKIVAKGPFLLVGIVFLFFFTTSSIQAQTISRQVIGISGGTAQMNKTTINWTAGQQFVKHVKSDRAQFRITEGFQQPNIKIENLNPEVNLGVTIAPNPVGDIMTIYSSNPQSENLRFNLIDASGKLLMADQVLDHWANEVSMQHLSKGTYYMELRTKNNEERQTLKVVKIK